MKKNLIFFILMSIHIVAFALPAKIIIFPHAQKQVDSPHLSAQGKMEAAALKNYILNTGALRPDIIIANSTPHQRALGSIETCGPIAKTLKVALKTNFLESQYPSMVQALLNNPQYNHKNILICWDQHHIPAITQLIESQHQWHTAALSPHGLSPGYLIKFINKI